MYEDFDTVEMKYDGLLRIEKYSDFIHLSIHGDRQHIGRDMDKEQIINLIKVLTKFL